MEALKKIFELPKKSFPLVLFFMVSISTNYFSQNTNVENLSDVFKKSLTEDILDIWYPLTIDSTFGGFLSDLNYKWEMSGPQNKMLVTEARHVWTLSKMTEFLNEGKYKDMAFGGYEFLKDKMWDNEEGGFYAMRSRNGAELPFWGDQKNSYSNSFAIYALSAYFKATQDSSALDLAKEAFYWLDQKAHDKEYGGYFDLLDREGNLRENIELKKGDEYFIQSDWKDQNSSIHIMEAFTELYSIWKDPLLKNRLSEMLNIIRDKIIGEKNYLTLYMRENWEPISFRDSLKEIREANHYLDHVSYGHDVETAFLMLEASHELGIKDNTVTLKKAKAMVDHALKYGWDNNKGGFYYEGYYLKGNSVPETINSAKVWWVQAEGLNALLLMSKLFPQEKVYYSKFIEQWEYIKKYMIDHENGGWYEEGIDNSPNSKKGPKAHMWKVNYHNVRALMNCIKMLNEDKMDY